MQTTNNVEQQLQVLNQNLKKNPNDDQTLFQLGLLYFSQKDHLISFKHIQRAININPNIAKYYNVNGVNLILLQRNKEAKAFFLKSYALDPKQVEVCINLGTFALTESHFQDAICFFEKALQIKPYSADVYNNLTTALMATNRQKEAYDTIRQAITINPQHYLAKFNWAKLEKHFGQITTSENILKEVIETQPENYNAIAELADIYRIKNNDKEAMILLKKVLAKIPNHQNAHHYSGLIYYNQGDWKNAVLHFQQAYNSLQPSMFILGMIGHCQLALGDWHGWKKTKDSAKKILYSGIHFEPINPFIGQCLFSDLSEYQKICKIWGQYFSSKSLRAAFPKINYQHKKLRIGYISPNFTTHPVGLQINDLFKYHDKTRFEIYCFPTKVHNTSQYFEICKHGDRVIELDNSSFDDAIHLIRKHEIDILVDLAGPTDNHCYDILAKQPAPIQCHMLGATGTLGTPFIQYLISTKTIVQDEYLPYYTETPIRLPETEIARSGFNVSTSHVNRSDWGLPEHDVVILAYHNFYRIDEETWNIWMEILKQTHHTVLWVKIPNQSFLENLLSYAQSVGVKPNRIIPCYEKSLTNHWQHQAADFFIDSLSFTSGTCIFLSQWIGLPVLNYLGETPQARVGASFCYASTITEQVAITKEEYIQKAVSWANNPKQLAEIKSRLLTWRHQSPLFNPKRYINHLEKAFEEMWQDFILERKRQVIDIEPNNISD